MDAMEVELTDRYDKALVEQVARFDELKAFDLGNLSAAVITDPVSKIDERDRLQMELDEAGAKLKEADEALKEFKRRRL